MVACLRIAKSSFIIELARAQRVCTERPNARRDYRSMFGAVYVVAQSGKEVWRVCVMGYLRAIDSRIRSIALPTIARDSRYCVLGRGVGLRPAK